MKERRTHMDRKELPLVGQERKREKKKKEAKQTDKRSHSLSGTLLLAGPRLAVLVIRPLLPASSLL